MAFVPVSTEKLSEMKVGRASMRYTNRLHRMKLMHNIEERLNNWNVPIHYLWLDVAVVE